MEKIVIYGCGKIGKEAILHYTKKEDIEISFLCDSDSNKWGLKYEGIEIASPKELADRIEQVDWVVIATARVDEVIALLNKIGISMSKVSVYEIDLIKERYRRRTWSQLGEDMYLQAKFSGCKKGFYVDVGALHPFGISNTAWAYEQGWNGINIEPNIDQFRLFEVFRKRDININCGISDKEGELTYYCYEEPAYNGFNKNFYPDMPICEERIVKIRRLSDVFSEYKIKHIDFLDIDTEGMEMSVLKSIDFSVDIECILLEQFEDVDMLSSTQEYQFLKKMGYSVASRYGITTIYEKNH